MLTPKLVWTKACTTLSEQANTVLFLIKSLIRRYNISVSYAFHIFDRKVVLILTYGSEILGHSVRVNIEIFHRKYCKFILGIGYRSSNCVALGETGRLPLYAITYWLRVIRLSISVL